MFSHNLTQMLGTKKFNDLHISFLLVQRILEINGLTHYFEQDYTDFQDK